MDHPYMHDMMIMISLRCQKHLDTIIQLNPLYLGIDLSEDMISPKELLLFVKNTRK